MTFTKGVMIACGTAGAILATVSIVGQVLHIGLTGRADQDASSAPLAVILPPVDVKIGGDVRQMSVRLIVSGARERDILCTHVRRLQDVVAREAAAVAPGGSVAGNLDQVLGRRLGGVAGENIIERIEVTVTPRGGTVPVGNCRPAGT